MSVRFVWLGLALFLALSLPMAASAGTGSGEASAIPRLVKVHADWCGTCTALEPTWKELVAELGQRVDPHVFDVTDRSSLRQTRLEAERLGLDDFLVSHQGKTGTIALIGPDGSWIRTFKGELDLAPYRAALEEFEQAHGG